MTTQLQTRRPDQVASSARTCPYCGQPLLDRQAIQHLEQSEREAEETLRATVETKARALAGKLALANEKKVGKLEAQMAALKASHKEELRELRLRERAEAKTEAERAAEAKVSRELKKRERALNKFKDQIEIQQRQIEHLTADERGDMNEEQLLGDLRAAFPDDKIDRPGRGRAGGDILHRVCVRSGDSLTEAGLIVYECKDTQSWSNSFLEQAHKEGVRHKTPYLVIITRTFPRGEKTLCARDGVVIVHPTRVVELAHVVRRMVEAVHRASLTAAGQAAKSLELFNYLASAEFRQAFDALSGSSRSLTELLGKERDWHERTWAKRQAAYDDIRSKTAAVDARIRTIIENQPTGNGKVVKLRTNVPTM